MDLINLLLHFLFVYNFTLFIYLFYFINKRDEKQDLKDQQMQEILTNFSLNIQENTLLIKELVKESSDKDENK